ncbi:MAG: DUF1259 domain-containing protein, partial [Tepidisphaeraceae bacterium]
PMDGATMMMGDFCLTEQELPVVQKYLVDRGISISAVHNHVIAESKRMLFMHVGMRGDPAQLRRSSRRPWPRPRRRPAKGRKQADEDGLVGDFERGVLRLPLLLALCIAA